jgi:hypothetical protein
MRTDIENVDYDTLDAAGKVEYSHVLQNNVNTTILQLQKAREDDLADVLHQAVALRLSERGDLLARFVSFGRELLRSAMLDKQREAMSAQVTAMALDIARQGAPQVAPPKQEVPVEQGISDSPIISEEESEN